MELYEEISDRIASRRKMKENKFYIGDCPICDGKKMQTIRLFSKRTTKVKCGGCDGLGWGWIKGGGICLYR